MNECFSGAADGADLLFNQLATNAGHKVTNFTFSNQKYHGDPKDRVILTMMQLRGADKMIKRANEILQRKFPTRSEYVNDLIRRNYYQVLNAERIYGTQTITDGLVDGGTGFTVTMGILMGIPEVYIFETSVNTWMKWEGDLTGDRKWYMINGDVPKPYGKYAGIGAREITPEAVIAIKELYND